MAVQSSWYVDPINGSDNKNNDGSQSEPLQTLTEFAIRVNGEFIDNQVTVHILSDLATDDHANLRLRVGENGFVLFKGTVTTTATGTLTAVTTRSPANNRPNDITDSSLSDTWANLGYINKRIRLTSGTNSGAMAWLAKDLGSKKARVSGWVVDTEVNLGSLPWDPYADNCEAAVDDNYAVETLPKITDMTVEVFVCSEGALQETTRVVFEDLAVATGLDRHICVHIIGERYTCCFNRCDLGYVEPVPGGTLPLVNCMTYIASLENNVTTYLFGGFVRYYANTGLSNEIAVGCAALVHGGFWIWGGRLTVINGGVCVMETGSYSGIELHVGGVCVTTSGPIYGSCDSGFGAKINAGAMLFYGTSKPTITGTSGDARVGGTSKSWSEIPFFNTSNGAGITEWD